MRIQLGGLMSAFAVTDARDRPQLKKLLDHTKKFFYFSRLFYFFS